MHRLARYRQKLQSRPSSANQEVLVNYMLDSTVQHIQYPFEVAEHDFITGSIHNETSMSNLPDRHDYIWLELENDQGSLELFQFFIKQKEVVMTPSRKLDRAEYKFHIFYRLDPIMRTVPGKGRQFPVAIEFPRNVVPFQKNK